MLPLTSPDDQLAVVFGGEVLIAPAVSAVIPDGSIQVSGASIEDGAALIRAHLMLAIHSVGFSVEVAQAAG